MFQICELIIPVLCHATIYRLVEECQLVASELSEATVRINSLLKHGERLSRDLKFQPRRFEAFIQEVNVLELIVSQTNSLLYKFNPSGVQNDRISDIIGRLVVGKEVLLEKTTQSDVGNRILSMFVEAQKISVQASSDNGEYVKNSATNIFTPVEKEFVMRVHAVKPAIYSSKFPQFLRAILNRNEFRLVGAFSEDTVFF